MASNFIVSVGALSSPSSELWNNLLTGLLDDGVYSGGAVLAAGGLNLKVEPFAARTHDKTVRMTGDWFNFNLPSILVGTGTLLLVAQVSKNSRLQDILKIVAVSAASLTADMVALAKLDIPVGTVHITSNMIDTSVVKHRSLNPESLYGRIRNGSGNFKLDNVHAHNFGNLRYSVIITPANSAIAPGTITVEYSEYSFTVLNNSQSVERYTWTAIAEEPESNVQGIRYGQTQVSSTGILITHNLGLANYFPAIIPLETPTAHFWVESVTDNSFILKTSGSTFRAIWAAIPTQASLVNGTANWNAGTVVVAPAFTEDYVLFATSLSSSCPTTPATFTKTSNGFTIVGAGAATGQFKYLAIPKSKALTGQIDYGSAAVHSLNRDDYLPLIENLVSEFQSIEMGKSSFSLKSGTSANFAAIPANNSWALGDWTRPSIRPLSNPIEISGKVNPGQSGIIERRLVSKDNFITKGMIQVAPAIPGQALSLQLKLNGTIISQLDISSIETSKGVDLTPIPVRVGDVLEVRLNSSSPVGHLLFNWYGEGNVDTSVAASPLNGRFIGDVVFETGTFNAFAGNLYMVSLSAASVATLPANPEPKDVVGFKDVLGNFATYNLTLDLNGKNFEGSAVDPIMNVSKGSKYLIYANDITGWVDMHG